MPQAHRGGTARDLNPGLLISQVGQQNFVDLTLNGSGASHTSARGTERRSSAQATGQQRPRKGLLNLRGAGRLQPFPVHGIEVLNVCSKGFIYYIYILKPSIIHVYIECVCLKWGDEAHNVYIHIHMHQSCPRGGEAPANGSWAAYNTKYSP